MNVPNSIFCTRLCRTGGIDEPVPKFIIGQGMFFGSVGVR